MVCAGGSDKVCKKPRGDSLSRPMNFVLARVPEVRQNHVDGFGKASSRRINHEKKFNEVVIHVTRTASLYQKDFLPTEAFVVFDVFFPAGEILDGYFSQSRPHVLGNALCKFGMGRAGKDLKFFFHQANCVTNT
jgi:hypothetical protein